MEENTQDIVSTSDDFKIVFAEIKAQLAQEKNILNNPKDFPNVYLFRKIDKSVK